MTGIDMDADALERFLGVLFQGVEWEPGQSIALRGLAEKNSTAPGPDFREQAWVCMDGLDDAGMAAGVEGHARRWNENHRGAFVIPAVMKASSLELRRQTEGDVAAFTSIVLDLDNPDTAEDSLFRIEGAIGPASIILESSPGKLHAYWVLTEPQTDTERVAKVRHVLALKSGGDPSFQRIPQVIRIPGTLNGKNDGAFQTVLRRCEPGARHDFDNIEGWVDQLYPLPWSKVAEPGGMDLLMAAKKRTAGSLLTETVAEGGQGSVTRWEAAGKVFGHYVHAARSGEVTLEEARDLAKGWMLAHMDPPWTDERFDRDWIGVVNRDTKNHGAIVDRPALFGPGEITGPAHAAPVPIPDEGDLGLRAWALRRWVVGERPVRRWLVRGLIRAGATHVLASEGGVGKTFALLDLCMKIAAGVEGEDWLGQPLVGEHTGGTAVLLTAEDDMEELHIRLHDMDPQGKRFDLGDRVIVLPMVQAGGVFQLVEIGAAGVARPSARWAQAMAALAAIPDLQFVAIDTMAATLHGEDNASIIIQQYVTALNMLRGQGAHMERVATLITHHVRKQSARDQPVQSAEEMRTAIRGSNALMGAARMALGIWQPPDWKDRLKRMGLPERKNSLFRLAVVKGNNPEAMDGERTLIRAPHGGLMDATARDKPLSASEITRAWFRKTVERGVEVGKPWTIDGQFTGIAQSGQLANLPPALRELSEGQRRDVLKEMVKTGGLQRTTKGGELDLFGGPLAADSAAFVRNVGGALTLHWDGWTFDVASQMVVGPNGTSMG